MTENPNNELTVMLVEDSSRDRRIIQRYFDRIDRWDIETITASQPEDGLAALTEDAVDILLLDHRLGQIDGLNALDEFRAAGYDGPAILTTGTGNERLAGKFIRAGGDDYLSKQDLGPELLKESFEFVTKEHQARKDRQQRKQELLQQARHDDLTGLYGRRYFMNKLRNTVSEIQENDVGTFTLLLIDLDNFKDVNDNLGHTVGDSVLENVAEAIRESTGNDEIPGRYGGDEFCVLLPDRNEDEAVPRAKTVFQAIQNALKNELGENRKKDFGASCSIGVYEYHSEDSINDVIERTDEALMRGKASGKESIILLTDDGTESIDTERKPDTSGTDRSGERINSVPQRDSRREFELEPIAAKIHQNGDTIEAKVLDVSESGLRIVCKTPPDPDKSLHVEFSDDRENLPLDESLDGEIKWIHVEAGVQQTNND